MRFLIVSDTHGDARNLSAVLSVLGRAVDGIIHCGDGSTDLAGAMHLGAPMPPAYPVKGNADSLHTLPAQLIVCAGKRRILVAHGHRLLRDSSMTPLLDEAKRNQACACFFGHTHIPCYKSVGRILLVNPGSLSKPRSAWGPSFAVVEIPDEGSNSPGIAGSPGSKCGFDVKFYELKGTYAKPRFHAFRP